MFFRRFKTPGLAQHSYLLECGGGAAVVVDPRRDGSSRRSGHASCVVQPLQTA